jgi:hypothetical protein
MTTTGGASILASRSCNKQILNVIASPDNKLPQRQNPASGVHIQLGQSNIVLLSINTGKREPWLNHETVHQYLRQTWSDATAWLVGDYLLMRIICICFAPREICKSRLKLGSPIGNANSVLCMAA